MRGFVGELFRSNLKVPAVALQSSFGVPCPRSSWIASFMKWVVPLYSFSGPVSEGSTDAERGAASSFIRRRLAETMFFAP